MNTRPRPGASGRVIPVPFPQEPPVADGDHHGGNPRRRATATGIGLGNRAAADLVPFSSATPPHSLD